MGTNWGYKGCSVDGCDSPKHYAKTLCRKHYARTMVKPKPRKPVQADFICSYEGCETQAKTLFLCSAHYYQKTVRGYLSPVNRKKVVQIDENGRVCTKCSLYQPWENYYSKAKSNGEKKQSNCKTCFIERSRKSRAAKEVEI